MNEGTGGTPEFQAFELFEDNVITDEISIEEDVPVSRPKTSSRSLTSKAPPSSQVRSSPRAPEKSPKAESLLPDDLDLLGDAPPKREPTVESSPPSPSSARIQPPPGRSQPKPPIQPPPPKNTTKVAAPPPVRSAPPPSIQDFNLSLDDDPVLEPSSRSHPASSFQQPESEAEATVEYRLESVVQRFENPKPEAPVATFSNEFFLPFDFDPFAAPAKRSGQSGLGVLEFDGTPALIEQDFEIEDSLVRTASDGVAVVSAATDDEIAQLGTRPADYNDTEPRDRTRRREYRRARAKKYRVHSDVRGRWAVVHWGLTIEIIALAMFMLAALLAALSMVFGILVQSILWSGILVGAAVILMALREVVVMLGYGLCIAAPARNTAWLWALLALVFAFAAMFGNVFALIFPLAYFAMPLTFVSWFFYLIYLKSIAESLKTYYLAEEAMNLMKLLGLMLMGTLVVWAAMLAFVLIVGPVKSVADASMMGLVLGTCSLVFGIISIIMAAVVTYKYWYILMNLREEIGWRLES